MKLLSWVLMMLFTSAVLAKNAPTARPAEATPDVHLSTALSKPSNETRGQRIYELHCQQCHQRDGWGSATQKVPALAGQHYEYLVKQVVDFLGMERASATMHQQLISSGMNNATSIADVVGYVANLPRNPAPQTGTGTSLAQGKRIFETDCTSCHGKNADGRGDLWVPSLRGQHYEYLVDQLQRMSKAQRGNVSEDLHRMFTAYANDELQAVADYLTRWNQ